MQSLNPPGWNRPKGYSNGIAAEGRFVFVAGMVGYNAFVGGGMEAFWGDSILVLEGHNSIEAAQHVPPWVKWLPIVMAAGGIGLAWLMYIGRPGMAEVWANAMMPLYLLSYNKWYFDELYDLIFVRPAFYLGRNLWKNGDEAIIDGVGPDGIAALTQRLSRKVSAWQSGYLYHYAFAMLIGVVVCISGYIFVQAGEGTNDGLLLRCPVFPPLAGVMFIVVFVKDDARKLVCIQFLAV